MGGTVGIVGVGVVGVGVVGVVIVSTIVMNTSSFVVNSSPVPRGRRCTVRETVNVSLPSMTLSANAENVMHS